MKLRGTMLAVFLLTLFSSLLFSCSISLAEDEKDIFADYNADLRKTADAKVNNVYNAWGDNMAKLIESGYRDGIVVEGPGTYGNGHVHVDGAGNVVVDKHANVGTIVNKSKFQNTNVIIKKDTNNSGIVRKTQ